MNETELRRALRELQTVQGLGTTLVSYLVSPTRAIAQVQEHLAKEIGEAQNIKNRSTRHAVTDALTNALTTAREYKETPQNGLAIYVSAQSRYAIEPPAPLPANEYRCDKTFLLQPLEAMLLSTEVFALIVMDRKEATLGWLRGSSVTESTSFESRVMSKTGKGGSSSNRYARIVEETAHEFFKKVADTANREYVGKELVGIAVGGPGMTKDEWLELGLLDYRLKVKVLPTFDVGYTNEYGLRELAKRVEERMPTLESAKETALLKRFFDGVRTGKAVYGEKQVREAAEAGKIELLILSEAHEGTSLGGECLVAIVTVDSVEGQQFKAFGGIGAILRY